jgi:KaiC/GvpD/RAD55 family RecA-like ATPase
MVKVVKKIKKAKKMVKVVKKIKKAKKTLKNITLVKEDVKNKIKKAVKGNRGSVQNKIKALHAEMRGDDNVSKVVTKRREIMDKKAKGDELDSPAMKIASLAAEREKTRVHVGGSDKVKKINNDEWIKTGIDGFDGLLENGIPKGVSLLVAGGPGTGKTIFCLQTAKNACLDGKKVLYMTFEESEERLIKHMEDFGWKPKEMIKKKDLMVKRFDPFDVTRAVEAMLEESKGELLIHADPIIVPKGFKPDIIIVDSLSAIASAFVGKEESYRIYIEHLFRFFEKSKATAFLITEIVELAKSLTEEFLADGVIVFYHVKRGNMRERAIEILKLRGAGHEDKIVALEITGEGLKVYPEQEVFGSVGEKD